MLKGENIVNPLQLKYYFIILDGLMVSFVFKALGPPTIDITRYLILTRCLYLSTLWSGVDLTNERFLEKMISILTMHKMFI
jgi:hypothetical protein